MKKIQIRNLFDVAVEMKLSAKYYAVILFQLNKEMAIKLRRQWITGRITQIEYSDRLVDSILREVQSIS
jgi:hypothetical protein